MMKLWDEFFATSRTSSLYKRRMSFISIQQFKLWGIKHGNGQNITAESTTWPDTLYLQIKQSSDPTQINKRFTFTCDQVHDLSKTGKQNIVQVCIFTTRALNKSNKKNRTTLEAIVQQKPLYLQVTLKALIKFHHSKWMRAITNVR